MALVAASALLLSGVAVAQDREEIEAKAEERLEQVIENLELTDEQVEAIERDILENLDGDEPDEEER